MVEQAAPPTFEVQANDLRHMVDTVRLIAEDTGQPVERIFDDSLHDHWYTAEARDYGFIDAMQKRAKPGRPITEQRPRPADPS